MSRQLAPRAYAALKTASALLNNAVGGIDAAASVTRVGRSRIAEAGNPNMAEMFHAVDVVLDLETAAGTPHVTSVLAQQQGYELVRVLPADGGELASLMARLGQDFSLLFRDAMHAVGGGAATPEECGRMLADLSQLAADIRDATAVLESQRTRADRTGEERP